MTKRRILIILIALLPFAVFFCANASLGGVKRVKIETTLGTMYLELYKDKAPKTVNNFLSYAVDGFYDGTVFHRVIRDFMAQGGGFTEAGVQKETKAAIENEAANGLKNTYGTIAMARTQDPHSATSQFFINTGDNSFLDHRSKTPEGFGYCVFGKVIAGSDVLEKINTAPVIYDPTADSRSPAKPVPAIGIKKVEAIGAGDPGLAEALKAEAVYQQAREAYLSDPYAQALDYAKALGYDISKFQTTASGLKILHVKEGKGANPKPQNTVEVHYEGWLPGGMKFDSSRERGERISFPLNGVIRGWTEGVGYMKPGGRAILIVPYQLGYGEAGAGPIPPRSTLIFDVELFAIAAQ